MSEKHREHEGHNHRIGLWVRLKENEHNELDKESKEYNFDIELNHKPDDVSWRHDRDDKVWVNGLGNNKHGGLKK
jgi:hypothetical protein